VCLLCLVGIWSLDNKVANYLNTLEY